jgi:hypothetical protein
MVRIFADASGEFVVQTTALDVDSFISELAEALHAVMTQGDVATISADGGLTAMGVLKNAMPIAYKLSGYKADTVVESRTLVCGTVSPNNCKVLASAGR